MKRILRILLLGPIVVGAAIVFTAVMPLLWLILWLLNDEANTVWEFVGEIWRDAPRFIWTGK